MVLACHDVPPRKLPPGIALRVNADGSKTYEIRWRDGGGRDGRRLTHSFPNLKLAQAALDRIHVNGNSCDCPKHGGIRPHPSPETPTGPTFGEYARRHAAALTGVGEGYRRDVLRDLARHLQPFADLPLDAISFLDVREWVRGMETGAHPWLTRPLSPTTVRRVLAEAGSVMAAAMNDGQATRNPFRGHRLARKATDENAGMTFLTHAEWRFLEEHLPEGTPRDLCGFLIGSGLRWGEATAAAVGAVDLLATPPRVYVGRAWKKDGKGGVVLGAPKSARSRRTVPLVGWVRDLLIPHVAGKSDNDFLFTGARGGPLSHHSNFYNKVWIPAVERAQAAGLEKRPRIHDLRHSHASWLLAEGVSMTEVSRRLGHQSYHVTDQRYAHVDPLANTASAAALERYRTRPLD